VVGVLATLHLALDDGRKRLLLLLLW
jgi:hypothetical protein